MRPIEVCMHPSAFLSMARKTYSGWLLYEELLFEFGRVGVHQLQNTLFHCLISVAAHTTCCRNVNFLILFGGTRPLSTRLMPNFQMLPYCRCHLCFEDIFFGKFCPKDKQTKAKRKTKKKTATILTTTAKENKKYMLFVSI